MENLEQAGKNPEQERRALPKEIIEQEFSTRAQHVLADYLVDNPDNEIGKMLREGLISEERAYKTLLQQARDPLTKVQRRDILPYVMNYEMWLHRENGQPFVVGFYDIDNFKSINTDYDHSVGDSILQKSAKIIAESVRETDDMVGHPDKVAEDEVVRHGGEEFLVIYPNTSKDNARVPAERLLERYSREMHGAVNDERPLTLSGGLVEYDPSRHADWAALVKEGSQTVLAAKEAGKNRIVISGAETESEAA